jgi:hypothetical protein
MKRMSILLGWCFAVTAILSNGTEANRHETEIFFGANCNRRDRIEFPALRRKD